MYTDDFGFGNDVDKENFFAVGNNLIFEKVDRSACVGVLVAAV